MTETLFMIYSAAAAAVMMQGIPRHGEGDTRIAVGRLVAGEGRNVTPVHAFMQCETRGSMQEINEYMFESVRRIVEGCAASYGVECRVTKAGEATNFEATPAACDLAVEACAEVFGRDHVASLETAGGSEDCSILARRAIEHGAEATFLFYGCNHHGHHRAAAEQKDRPVAHEADTVSPAAFFRRQSAAGCGSILLHDAASFLLFGVRPGCRQIITLYTPFLRV